MHAALLDHQDALERDDLLRYAADLGLDVARFERDLAGHAYAGRVHEDVEGGRRSGVTGTPTYFINGARYDGDDKPGPLGRAIEQALAGDAPAAP